MTNDSLEIFVSADGRWIKKDAAGVTRFRNEVGKNIQDLGRGVREHFAPLRWTKEKLFTGYGEQMEQLREVDDQIQTWTRDLDNVLNHAQDARKQGRYLDVFYWLNQINSRLRLATQKGKEVSDVTQEKLDEYFGKSRHGIPDDYFTSLDEDNLADPNQRFASVVRSFVRDEIIITAGILTDLGQQITTWQAERMYRKRVQEMKRAMDMLLGYAKITVGNIYAKLAMMSKARASGDIGSYTDALIQVGKIQHQFESKIKSVYNSKGFKEMADRLRAKQMAELPELADAMEEDDAAEEKQRAMRSQTTTEGLATHNLADAFEDEITPVAPVVPAAPAAVMPAVTPVSPEAPPSVPSESIKTPNELEAIKENVENPAELAPTDLESPSSPEVIIEKVQTDEPVKKTRKSKAKPKEKSASNTDYAVVKLGHEKFLEELTKASNKNDPYLMAAMLLRYSEMIDESDPEMSLKLLAIAEGIVDA